MAGLFSKTEVDEQLAGVDAEIYVHEGAATQEIPNGAGYTKVTSFTTDGDSQNCTADSANDKLTLTLPGRYKTECSISFTATGTNVVWSGALFIGGVEQDKVHFERKIGVGGDFGSTQFGGRFTTSSVPVDVDLRVRHDDGSAKDITVKYANLNTVRTGIGS